MPRSSRLTLARGLLRRVYRQGVIRRGNANGGAWLLARIVAPALVAVMAISPMSAAAAQFSARTLGTATAMASDAASERRDPLASLGSVADEAAGVIIRFDSSSTPVNALDEALVAELVQNVLDTPSLAAGDLPEVVGADELGGSTFGVDLAARVSAGDVLHLVRELQEATPDAIIEPNWVIRLDPVELASVGSSATQIGPPWGLDRIDQTVLPLNNQYSYGTAEGAGVRIYIVDSGVRPGHVDVAGRVDPGYSGIHDGRGTDDCNGHGTHVAGTAAGTYAGVAKAATIVPVRVFGCGSSTETALIIDGLNWIMSDIAANPGPAVVNMSLAGPYSALFNEAVAAFAPIGVPVVVASGNSATHACGFSPASEPTAVTVNASDRTDRYAEFSNYGSCTDLYAPGVDIVSAGIGSDTAWASLSGTSMAAPHVTGAIAVLLSAGVADSTDFGELLASLNPDVIDTGGVPDDPTSLLLLEPRDGQFPSAPRDLAASPRAESVQLSWRSPQNLNGGTLLDYEIRYRAGASGAWTTVNDGVGTQTSATVANLVPQTVYQFAVAAKSTAGRGELATIQTTTQSGLAVAPHSVAATAGAWRVTLAWGPPAATNGGTVSDYVVRFRAGSTGAWSTFVDGVHTSRSAIVTGLTEGVRYEFRVAAVTQYGLGTFSSAVSATPCCIDVPVGRAFATEIRWLADRGITGGYSDGTFRPLGSVNRDAMAAFLYRAAGSPPVEPPAASPFVDVTTSTPFYREIMWLASTGITGGYSDGTFRPSDPVNRDAMAAFLYRFANRPAHTPPSTSPFVDVAPQQPFYKEIAWLSQRGVSGGFSDGTFRPGSPVSRDAMAAFLYRFESAGFGRAP